MAFLSCSLLGLPSAITTIPSMQLASSMKLSSRPTILCSERPRVTKTKPKAKRKAKFRPCIDIHKGTVKQIVGSSLKDQTKGGSQLLVTNFVSEKASDWYARLYREDDLEGGHVIMLGQDPESREAALAAVKAFPGGLHVGGEIDPNNAKMFLDAGASHIIVTSYIFENGQLEASKLQNLVRLYDILEQEAHMLLSTVHQLRGHISVLYDDHVDTVGADRIVLDLSCRFRDDRYWVVTDRWQHFSRLSVDAQTMHKLSESCAEFLVHGVDVEGKQCGIDEDLIKILSESSPIPVTYAGGVKDIDDLDRVDRAGNGRVDVTVGSALDIFGGTLPYLDVIRWHRRDS